MRPWLGAPEEKLGWCGRRTDWGRRAAWRVVLPLEEPMGDWEVFLDARDGSCSAERFYVQHDGSGLSSDRIPDQRAGLVWRKLLRQQRRGHGRTEQPALRHRPQGPDLQQQRVQPVGSWVSLLDFESPVVPPVTLPIPAALPSCGASKGSRT